MIGKPYEYIVEPFKKLNTLLAEGYKPTLSKYPIFDENYRNTLNLNLIGYLGTARIGYKTQEEFDIALQVEMQRIMQFWNRKYIALQRDYETEYNLTYRDFTEGSTTLDTTTNDTTESTTDNDTTSNTTSKTTTDTTTHDEGTSDTTTSETGNSKTTSNSTNNTDFYDHPQESTSASYLTTQTNVDTSDTSNTDTKANGTSNTDTTNDGTVNTVTDFTSNTVGTNDTNFDQEQNGKVDTDTTNEQVTLGRNIHFMDIMTKEYDMIEKFGNLDEQIAEYLRDRIFLGVW